MRKSIVTLGTFDGVHLGHQRILRKVVQRARQTGARSVVLAFAMPPRIAKEGSNNPVLLTSWADKLRILKRLGIDHVEALVFDRRLASTPPRTFFVETFMRRFAAAEVVVGPRVAFGKNREGKLPLLRVLGLKHEIRIHVVPPLSVQGWPVSSSRIRDLLLTGDVEKANRILGYPYFISGPVMSGDHRGRALGFPTANIHPDPWMILPPGVFWVKVFPSPIPVPLQSSDLRRGWDGLCNVGTRPTFKPRQKKLLCEVFLFKSRGSLYGHTLRVVFMRQIRSEKRFDSADELQRQIQSDFQKGRQWSDSFALQNRAVSI